MNKLYKSWQRVRVINYMIVLAVDSNAVAAAETPPLCTTTYEYEVLVLVVVLIYICTKDTYSCAILHSNSYY